MAKKPTTRTRPRKYDRLKQDGDDASAKKPVVPEARKQTVPEARQRIDVHEAITAKIITAIEAGAGEFKMPWHRPGIAFTLPKNALTEKTYRGSNVLSLWIDADDKKYQHQVWATYKQYEELGAQVRKGERGSLIVKYGEWVPKEQNASAAAGQSNGHQGDDDYGSGPNRLADQITTVHTCPDSATHMLTVRPSTRQQCKKFNQAG